MKNSSCSSALAKALAAPLVGSNEEGPLKSALSEGRECECCALIRHAGSVGHPRQQGWPLARPRSSAGSAHDEEETMKHSCCTGNLLTWVLLP